jgi:peptidyl-prolyl cis-trans isomerase C
MKHAGILAAAMLSVALAAPAVAQDVTAATVVATVNSTEITLGHMIALRDRLPAQYQSLPDDVLFKGILDQLIQQATLEQSMEGKLTRRDELNIENDRRGYISQLALQSVVAAAVTDAAIQAAYDARIAGATPATEYNAAHILVATEDEAKAIQAELAAGGDFHEIARAKSTDTGSGANGGDLGWFGLGMMVAPFEAAVVAAEIGKVAGPVQSDFGWHLILVRETRVAAQPTLDEMRDELAAEVEQGAIEAHLAGLSATATVTRPGESIDPTVLKDASLLDN